MKQLKSSLWNEGPPFLCQPREEWMEQKRSLAVEDLRVGLKKQCVFNFSALTIRVRRPSSGGLDVQLEHYYSSHHKLVRRVA